MSRCKFSLLFSLLLCGTCLAEPVDQKREGRRPFPFGENFIATSVASTPFETTQPTLVISSDLRLSGFSGCNTYAASAYPLVDGRLKVGPLAVTKKACDARLSKLEEVFLAALQSSNKWTHSPDGRGVILTTPYGPMKFARSF